MKSLKVLSFLFLTFVGSVNVLANKIPCEVLVRDLAKEVTGDLKTFRTRFGTVEVEIVRGMENETFIELHVPDAGKGVFRKTIKKVNAIAKSKLGLAKLVKDLNYFSSSAADEIVLSYDVSGVDEDSIAELVFTINHVIDSLRVDIDLKDFPLQVINDYREDLLPDTTIREFAQTFFSSAQNTVAKVSKLMAADPSYENVPEYFIYSRILNHMKGFISLDDMAVASYRYFGFDNYQSFMELNKIILKEFKNEIQSTQNKDLESFVNGLSTGVLKILNDRVSGRKVTAELLAKRLIILKGSLESELRDEADVASQMTLLILLLSNLETEKFARKNAQRLYSKYGFSSSREFLIGAQNILGNLYDTLLLRETDPRIAFAGFPLNITRAMKIAGLYSLRSFSQISEHELLEMLENNYDLLSRAKEILSENNVTLAKNKTEYVNN